MLSRRLKVQAVIVILLGAIGAFSPPQPASANPQTSGFVCDCRVCHEGFMCPDLFERDALCEAAQCYPFACGYCEYQQGQECDSPGAMVIPCAEAE